MKLTIKDEPKTVVTFGDLKTGNSFLLSSESCLWVKSSESDAVLIGRYQVSSFAGYEVVTPVRILSVEVERL